jgi:deazaflavin-dependent oxidoreductase (nitroreductase family)
VITDLLERTKVLTLTTIGRVTGQPHAVELWFVYHQKAKAVYLLSYPGTEGQGTDWYRNALARPEVTLAVRGEAVSGVAAPAPESDVEKVEKQLRDLFTEKYGRAMISHYYGDEARLPLKIEVADAD